MIFATKRTKLSGLLALVMIAALAVVGVSHAIGFASGKDGAPLPVNSEGITYGSMLEAEMNGTEMPELVSCIATNGERGYMYYEEYSAITQRDFELSSEELNSIMPDRTETIAKVFAETANTYYGYELLSIEEVKEALSLITSVDGTEAAITLLEGDVRSAVLANETVSGGEIVHGGNAADAVKAVQFQRMSFFGDVAESVSFDGSSNAVIIDSSRLSEALATNYMNTMEYAYFYQKAKDAVGIALPVYERDGRTVIGEIVIDSL